MAEILTNILNNILNLIQKMGKVTCITTAFGKSPDGNNPEVDVTPGEASVSVEEPNAHLTVSLEESSATPESGYYCLGDVIAYKITVVNDGSVTIEDVTVIDELTGDEWTVDALPPAAYKDFTCEYVVSEADIMSGVVENVATANGTPKDTDSGLVVEPGKASVMTEGPNAHITIDTVVDSEPASGEAYTIGEKVAYRTTVTNDGNLTISDIVVVCDLTGDEWKIASLTPGEQKTFFHEYTITESDIH